MESVEKGIFISYRHSNAPWALAIYENLQREYDVFFDYQSIASGDFERILLAAIRSRAHFILVLTPSALEGCGDPNDWLRREIQTALEAKRNIVPVMLEGFDFGSPAIEKHLTGELAALKQYNGLRIPAEYFSDAMGRLRDKYLNIPLNAVLHPESSAVQQAVKNVQIAANAAPHVQETKLKAQEWFERGVAASDHREQIRCYNESIRLYSRQAVSYNNRGVSRGNLGDMEGEIEDYSEAIRLNPNYSLAYFNRGRARHIKGDFDRALVDYNNAIRCNPNDPDFFRQRAKLFEDLGGHHRSSQYFKKAAADIQVAVDLQIEVDRQNGESLKAPKLSDLLAMDRLKSK